MLTYFSVVDKLPHLPQGESTVRFLDDQSEVLYVAALYTAAIYISLNGVDKKTKWVSQSLTSVLPE